MLEYTAAKAKSHLLASAREAEARQDVSLTRRGKPVATLISTASHKELTSAKRSFREAFQSFRGEYDLAALEIDPDQVYGNFRDQIARRGLRTRKTPTVVDGQIVAMSRLRRARGPSMTGRGHSKTDDGWPLSVTKRRVSAGHGFILALAGPG